MTFSQAPTYNLKAVIKETGLTADTLRAWERRYGLPTPQRTRGGHRLYSEHDIHVIKWLRRQQSDGLAISRAVGKWNDLVSSGSDPLNEAAASTVAARAAPAPARSKVDVLRAEWLSACMAYDEGSAENVLNEAFALYSPETVVIDLIQGAMHEIGELWQRGGATVQQEHFMSSLCMRRLDALVAASPSPVHSEVVVLACPEFEQHVLPLQFLHVLLRRAGRHVVLLGADVPMAQLEDTVREVKPALVVMAAQQLTTASSLKEAAALLHSLHIPAAFGGRVFDVVPELRAQIAGSFLGEEIKEAVNTIDSTSAPSGCANSTSAGRCTDPRRRCSETPKRRSKRACRSTLRGEQCPRAT